MDIALVSILPLVYEGVTKSNCPPLGLLYVGSALKRHGYDVKIFHIYPHEISATVTRIIREEPIFAGFTALTGVQLKFTAEMSRKIKERSDIPIVWGGVHPSLLPEQCLTERYIDIVVIGEGEEIAVELAKSLKNKTALKTVKGIGYKDNGCIVLTEPRPFIKNLDDCGIDWNLIKVDEYLMGPDRMLAFATSRGCPYKCTFCYNAKFNKRRWRGHSAKFVISEIEKLKGEYDVGAVDFTPDDSFFSTQKRAIEIIEAIRIPWCCETRVDHINETVCKKLRETECRRVFLGLESGNDRCLEVMQKGFRVMDSLKAIKLLSRYPEIEVKASFIMGIPTETWEEIERTVNFALHLKSIHPNIFFNFQPFLPYPGTELYDAAIGMGFHPPQRTIDWTGYDRSSVWELTWLPWMTGDYTKKIRLIDHYFRIFGGLWLEIGSIDGIINRMVRKRLVTREFPFHCPLELNTLKWIKVRRNMAWKEHPRTYKMVKKIKGMLAK